jgi:nuclear pore complex protein Nup155
MGLFPQLQRAWITIDHRLFIWNYIQGSDFYTFEENDQVILSVALVKPRAGVFIESIDYVLVIATPLEISLLGVTVDRSNGSIALFLTQMAAPCDNLLVSSIAGTSDGRVFLCGNSNDLYELVYQPVSGWFSSKRCYLVNLTASSLSYLLPTFVPFVGGGADDHVVAVAVDDSRQLLYTLSAKSNVQIFNVGTQAGSVHLVSRLDNLRRDITHLISSLHDLEMSTFRLVSIHVVTAQESRKVCMVGVAASGHRLYFGLVPEYGSSRERVALVHVRHPPTSQARGSAGKSVGLTIHVANYVRGVLLAANSLSDDSDNLLCIAHDSGKLAAQQTRQLSELSELKPIHGKTWTISELHWDTAHLTSVNPLLLNNELYTQFVLPPRQFLAISNTGVSFIQKNRPLDALLKLLQETYVDERVMAAFVDAYGATQVCAMCLAIASGYGLEENAFAHAVAENAKRLFIRIGGQPQFKQRPVPVTVADEIGHPYSAPETIYSSRHDGLALLLARVLRTIWQEKVATLTIAGKGQSAEQLAYTTLAPVQKMLSSLNELLSTWTLIKKPEELPWNGPEREVWENENTSLLGLCQLVKFATEGIAFLTFLMDNGMADVVQKCPQDVHRDFHDLLFEHLIVTPKGHELARQLVLTLIGMKQNERIGVDTISESLNKRCPSFCGGENILMFKAAEYLRQAKSSQIVKETDAYLKESLRLFAQVADKLKQETFEGICADYNALGFYAGSVRLALERGKSLLSSALQNDKVRTYDRAIDAIKLTLALHDQDLFKQHVLQEALVFDNYDFHTYLFDWYLRERLHTQLLDVPMSLCA